MYNALLISMWFILLLLIIISLRFVQMQKKNKILEQILLRYNTTHAVNEKLLLFVDLKTVKINEIVESIAFKESEIIYLIYSGPEWKLNSLKRRTKELMECILDNDNVIANSIGLYTLPSYVRFSSSNKILELGRLY